MAKKYYTVLMLLCIFVVTATFSILFNYGKMQICIISFKIRSEHCVLQNRIDVAVDSTGSDRTSYLPFSFTENKKPAQKIMQAIINIKPVFLKSSTGQTWLKSLQLKVSVFFFIAFLRGTMGNDFNPSTLKIKTGSITAIQYSALNPLPVFNERKSVSGGLDQIGKGL